MASINENGGMIMPVAPTGGNFGGFGGLGQDGAWWIILFIILFGAGGLGYGNGRPNGGSYANEIQSGFNQAALTSGITEIQSSLCNGFANVVGAVQNGFAQAEIAANSRQMADMQQNFSLQQGLNNCCCENRAAVADLKYTVATEACADRQAVTDALVTLTNQMNAGIQSLKDEFCQDRLARKDEIIADLRSQINEQSRLASQNAQTAAILANNEAQTAALEQYLAPIPRPAYIVQNPNCCSQNYGCGYAVA